MIQSQVIQQQQGIQQIPVSYLQGYTKEIVAQCNQVQMIYCPQVDANDIIVDEKINCIIPPNSNNIGGLYIGNYQAALQANLLLQSNIKAVLTASKETPIQYQPSLVPFSLQLDMSDNSELSLESYFQPSFEFIENGMKFGNVLVHCHMGISRSSAIILGYLMYAKQWTLEKALWVLKVKRPIANPNPGFMDNLFAYELKLLGKNSLVAQEKKQSTLPPFLKEILKKSPVKVVRDHQIVHREQQEEYIPLNKSYHIEEVPPDSVNLSSSNLNTSYLSTGKKINILSVSPSKNTSFMGNSLAPPLNISPRVI
ncbi:hypothetical protein ABPG72_015103 [Tetrahymena utriculariae]